MEMWHELISFDFLQKAQIIRVESEIPFSQRFILYYAQSDQLVRSNKLFLDIYGRYD